MSPAIAAAPIRLLRAALRTACSKPRRDPSARFAAVVAVVVVLCGVPGAVAASPVTVSVSSGTSLGTLSTQISSNNTWSGLVDQNSASKSNFAALNLPMVRLHVGDDGGAPAMPEIKQNQWSFANLDVLVNDETSIGQQVVMNVKFAPDWMWTCTKYQGAGDVADKTFKTFAAYMARLVSYYNKGTMTTETGTVINNPAGTKNRVTYWELWNEPDLSNETPCNPPDGMALTPAEYLTMWNAVAPAMLAVDPSLKFIGPATAGGQFGSETGAQNDYITTLMQSGNPKPYALSFHGYGYWDNGVSDNTMFVGDGSSGVNGGIDDIVAAAQAVHTTYPSMPIWITEVNVNAAWGDDPHGRPWGPFAAAWWGTAFADLVPQNMALIHQYDISSQPQFGLISDDNGSTRLPYWVVKTLNSAFPVNSMRLSSSSPDANIKVLAARRPDGKLSILVVNKRVDSANPSGGVGLSADVTVSLDTSASAVTLQQIDSSTSATSGPATVNVTPSQTLSLHFPGYGLAVFTVTTGAAPPPAPAASLSPSSLSFGSQTVGTTSAAKSSTLTNTGNAALTISGMSVTGTNAGDFAQSSNCPGSLAAGASCSISVTFTPGASGSRSASVSIADNASGSPHTLALSGTGASAPPPAPAVTLSPTSLSFGSQQVGTSSSSKSLTLTNSGNAALTISSIAVSGSNAADFAQTNTCGSTLAAGASCSASVTFSPSATGSRSAGLTVTDNASGSPHTATLSGTGTSAPPPPAPGVTLSPTSLSFGSQQIGTSSVPAPVTLTNSGTAALTISGIAVSGTNPGDFGWTTTCPTSPSTVPAGASCSVSVTFSPSATGSRSASLRITDDASGSPHTAALSGTGSSTSPPPGPAVSLTPGSLTFGTQAIATTSAAQSSTLKNTGSGPLTITSMSMTGSNPTDFARTTTCPLSPSTLAAGASCTISATFTPSASGTRTASVSITDDASGSPHQLSLTGTGGTIASAFNWAANDSADFDADHMTDLGGLYRGRTPQDALWYDPASGGGSPFQIWFGATPDVPVAGDYDGDGKTDAVIFRPSTGLWYGPRTGAAQIVMQMYLGQSGDIPVPGDYDGDKKTDAAIYRPSTGLFFAILSGGGTLGKMLGQSGDVPVPRDYDGDGKTDFAIYRPSTGAWTAQLSGGGTYTATNGQAGDIPVPADYNGDRRADPVVFRPSSGLWTGPYEGTSGRFSATLGQSGDVPIPGYYDSNKKVDAAIFRPSTGMWFANLSGGGTKRIDGLGVSSDIPLQRRPKLASGL
jgi:hypothetical protein